MKVRYAGKEGRILSAYGHHLYVMIDGVRQPYHPLSLDYWVGGSVGWLTGNILTQKTNARIDVFNLHLAGMIDRREMMKRFREIGSSYKLMKTVKVRE